jgi:cytochrome P450
MMRLQDSKALPPGPRFVPAVAMGYLRDSFAFYERCAARYGDPFLLPTPWGRLVVTGRPEGIETIFTAPPETFGIFARTVVEPLMGPTSLMVTSGAEHARNRRLLMPLFHTHRVAAYAASMTGIAAEGIGRLQPGQRFVAQDVMHAITLEIILSTFFGASDARKEKLRGALIAVQAAMGPAIAFLPILRRELGGIGPWAKFRRAIRELDAIVQSLCADARVAGSGEDVLALLVHARFDDGSRYSDGEIRDELVSLVYAGHETLAASLAWALYWIHRDGEVLQRLREELASLPDDAPPERVVSLPFLDAVCLESLRLGPVVPEVTRQLLRPLSLLGYELPEGLAVAASIALAHANEAVFADAREFRPSRFLGRKYSPFELLPFGGGTHRCLGAGMAMVEMKLVLATVLRCTALRLMTTGPVRATRRGVLLGPHDAVVFEVNRR